MNNVSVGVIALLSGECNSEAEPDDVAGEEHRYGLLHWNGYQKKMCVGRRDERLERKL